MTPRASEKRRGAPLPAALHDANRFTDIPRIGERLALAVWFRQIHFMSAVKTSWPHAPEHRLSVGGTYFVTASTYLREPRFAGKARLAVLHRGLLKVAADFGWQLEAWAVFSNHYHFVGHSPADEDSAASLSQMLGLLHERTAKWINKLDSAPARKVWHNFRETRLTYEKSYLARLNYTHQNPVKHGLVPVANLYPWCSARWFERTATPAQIKTIYKFKTSQIKVPDDFEVSPDW
jgi:putative transposase